MSGTTQEEILQSTRTVSQRLDALQEEHEVVKSSILGNISSLPMAQRQLSEENVSIVDKNLESIRLGIEEAQNMVALASYLQDLEAETEKLKTQASRLCQENAWLRDYLGSTQQKLQASAQQVTQLEEEKSRLQFINSGQKYDDDQQGTEAESEKEQRHDTSAHKRTQQEPGLRTEENVQGGNASFAQSASANALPDGASGGYEISHILTTPYKLITQYAAQGRHDVAIPLCKQVIEELERINGHNHTDVATMLRVLALIYRDQENYTSAANLLNDALAIRELCLGEDHIAVASTLNNLAVLYGKCEHYEEAEPLCKRALEIREKVLGHDHPDVAKQLNNLALLCQNQGKYDEAETHYRRALEIYEAKLGPGDSNVVKTKNNLASAYLKQRTYKEAEALYKQILTRAQERELGAVDDEKKSIRQVSANCEEKKNATDAGTENGGQNVVKADNPAVATTLSKLGALYRRQGKYQAAASLGDAALRAKKQGSK
ncbi:kinesin light chain protein 2 [Aphelenchoides avenae]|nr:kinesin light chain protein 2 [Aphelenchus avenae]